MKPMLAVEAENLSRLTYPLYGSPKLDGIRSVLDDGLPLTRSLKTIPNKYVSALLTAHGLPDLDGELIIGPPNAEDVYNRTVRGIMAQKGEPDFTLYVFDQWSLDLPYNARLEALEDLTRVPFIKILEQTWIKDAEQATTFYNNLLEDGYEGAMFRSPYAPYKFGRSTLSQQYLLKHKPFATDEAVVLEVLEGQHNGNPEFTNELGRTARSTAKSGMTGNGMVGGFLVLWQGKRFVVAPGKLTHKERFEIFANRKDYVGKILTFAHFPYGNLDLPRFGRWIGWRHPADMS